MNTRRIFIACAILGLIGMAMLASRHGTLTTRINNAHSDLLQAQAPIPQEALHARALQILRDRTVAEGAQ